MKTSSLSHPVIASYNCKKLLITDPVSLSVKWEENNNTSLFVFFFSLGFKLVVGVSILHVCI